MKIDSSHLSGDFLKFPYSPCTGTIIYDVVPETADPHIPVNTSFVKCIELIKNENESNVSIRAYCPDDVQRLHDGYSLKPANVNSFSGVVKRSTVVYALTNHNGHFFIPISTNSLLDDLVELTRKIKSEINIRVVFYDQHHNVRDLMNSIQKKIENIRKPKTRTVWEGSGEDRISRTETYYHKDKGGEFDSKSNDLVELMRDYPTTQLCTVFVYMRNTSDSTIIGNLSLSSVSSQFDSLRFVPVTPLKHKVRFFRKEEVPIVYTLYSPILFNVQAVLEKCTKGSYLSDGWGSRRKNSPLVCTKSKIVFPFSSPLVVKTVSSKGIADKVNEKNLFDADSKVSDDVVKDIDFFAVDKNTNPPNRKSEIFDDLMNRQSYE